MKLTDINDCEIDVDADAVVLIDDQPRGQTTLTLAGGALVQVRESVETVRQLAKKERTK